MMIMFLLFLSHFLFFQADDGFDRQFLELETLIFQTEMEEALQQIYEIEKTQSLTQVQVDLLKLLKVKAFVELEFFPEATEEINEIKSISNLPTKYQVDYYLQRALTFEWLNQLDKTKVFLDKAKEIIDQNKNVVPQRYGQYLYRLSSYYRVVGEETLSNQYAKESIEAGKKYDCLDCEMIGNMILGFNTPLEKKDTSIYYLNKAIDIAKQLKKGNTEGYLYLNLMNLYIYKKQYKQAMFYADKAYQFSQRRNLLPLEAMVYLQKSDLFERNGKVDSAYFYFKKFHIQHLQTDLESKKVQTTLVERRHNLKINELENEKLKERIQSSHKVSRLLGILLSTTIAGLAILALLVKNINNKRGLLLKQKNQIEEQNTNLQTTLQEKELLLRELNHRVKNNLSMILSLVRLQKAKPDTDTESWNNLEGRINAIVFAHQMHSYTNQNLICNEINLKEYCQTLFDSLALLSNKTINYQIEVDDIETPFENAIPIGILLNELITNSLKHATPKENLLKLKLSLSLENKKQTWLMNYSDNGCNFESDIQESTGMTIIADMVEQLDGILTREKSSYQIRFAKV